MRLWLRLLVVMGLFGALLGVGAGGAGGVEGVADAPAVGVACADLPSRGFVDVSEGNVHRGSIDCVAFYSVSLGCGSGEGFCPEDQVTRWQVALFLARVADLAGVVLGSGSGSSFEDLDGLPTDAVSAVRRLAEAGVIKGRSETVFNPYGLVTRGQMALLLVRFLALVPTSGVLVSSDGTVSVNGAAPDDFFADVTSGWPVEFDQAAGALFELGIARGRADGGFGPSAGLTRAQMASFLARMLDHVDLSGAGSTPVGGPVSPGGPIGPGPVTPPAPPPTTSVPPVAASGRINNLLLNERQVARVDLDRTGAEYFEGGGNTGFTYSVTSSRTNVASVRMDGPVVEVSARNPGTATVRVTATAADRTSGTRSFTVRVAEGVDYDSDGDGLLEITTLAQFDAIRLDLNGDGIADDAANRAFDDLYPGAMDAKGCPATGCSGYELAADLDFDTDGDGTVDADGAGWAPISPFGVTFDGNNHTISNLFINVTGPAGGDWGLFGEVTSTGEVRGVRLVDASVTATQAQANSGLLVGELNGVVRRSSAIGTISGGASDASVGGLVGRVRKVGATDPLVADSFASIQGTGGGVSGGLVGTLGAGVIERSYALGSFAGTDTTDGLTGPPDVGGLVGAVAAGTLRQVYAAVDVSVAQAGTDGDAGGLVGAFGGGTGAEAFVAGRVLGDNADTSTDSEFGGLVGVTRGGGIAASGVYWDTDVTGQSVAGVDTSNNATNGTGLTTAGLRSDTNDDVGAADYDGVFKDWDADVWDFGTSLQYPALVVDFNGDGVATWQEFGNQRSNTVRNLRAAPDVSLDQGESLLVGPTVLHALNAEGLRFSGSSINRSTATVSSADNGMTVTGVASGNTDVTITANHSSGGSESVTFTVTVTDKTDYDTDEDGLIEVSSLKQLNAIRWDLNGDGQPSSGDQASYDEAFPNAATRMGCLNSRCTGYELTTNLDFDTDNNNTIAEGDDYWNNEEGWAPLGEFTATFDGNGHTIDRLYLRPTTTQNAWGRNNWGLFDKISNTATLRNVGLTNVSITTKDRNGRVGALVGWSEGVVQRSFSEGEIVDSGGPAASVGGLVGQLVKARSVTPVVSDSYSEVNIVSSGGRAGGLAGQSIAGLVTRSYATGNVAVASSAPAPFFAFGGLLGFIDHQLGDTDDTGVVEYAYASGSVSAPNKTGAHAGALVGRVDTGIVHESLAVGAVGATGSVNPAASLGGVIGSFSALSPVVDADAYWDSTTTGQTSSVGGGTHKTTTELKEDTQSTVAAGSYYGIYRTWDDSVWDFGTSSQYPALVVDFNGDGVATWQEFGNQRQATSPSVYGAFADLTVDLGEVVKVSPAGVFHDRDGGTMTFTATSNGAAVRTRVDGGLVEVEGVTTGTATVTVRARSGSTVSDSFQVTVTDKNDYDSDGDGLIEVDNLAQLHVIRWDLDGDGTPTGDSGSNHAAAYPKPADSMGCPSTGCKGYELTTDLDFDTNNNGEVGPGDDYWNNSSGFYPIGAVYTAIFDGNNHTISNFHHKAGTGQTGGNHGLFQEVGRTGEIRGLRLVDVTLTAQRDLASVGALAGVVKGRVTRSSATGTVDTGTSGADAGGLVGVLVKDTTRGSPTPTITDSYAVATVLGNRNVGGLVGKTVNAEIKRSYATGTARITSDPGHLANVGGLVGLAESTDITMAYTAGDVVTPATITEVSPSAVGGHAGGLVGYFDGGTVSNAFAVKDVPLGLGDLDINSGGIVGYARRGTITDRVVLDVDFLGWGGDDLGGQSHQDASLSVSTIDTVMMREDTNTLVGDVNYDGVYENWDLGTWDFGTSQQYPALVADFNGDGTSSWEEFGTQRADRTVRKIGDPGQLLISQGHRRLVGPGVFHAFNAQGVRFVGSSDDSSVSVAGSPHGLWITGAARGTAEVTLTAISATGARQTETVNVGVSEFVAYDTDGDDLVEISNLAQLSAIRHDLDGDATLAGLTGAQEAVYNAAFPNRSTFSGCTNPCDGYELVADLDFDTNGNGRIDSGDTYWNDGAGWAPIGAYDGIFEGNGHTISNLHIDTTATSGDFGLFSKLDDDAVVRNVGLLDASVKLSTTATTNQNVGILAGQSQGRVRHAYSTGTVSGQGNSTVVGGLVGALNGTGLTTQPRVELSYSTAAVTGGKHVGGLVGSAFQADISGSYAAGSVGGTGSGPSDIGGLVGFADAAANKTTTINSSYATSAVNGHDAPTVRVGGLVGRTDRATISQSYSNSPTTAARSGTTKAGMVAVATVNTTAGDGAYWNISTSRASANAAGAARTGHELIAESNTITAHPDYDGIYGTWDHNKWDYGTAVQYPVLVADLNGDGASTWQEFGDQRSAAAAPTVLNPIAKASVSPHHNGPVPLQGSDPVFVDANLDPLTYTATSSDATVVSVSLSESPPSLTFSAHKLGVATITVEATDPGGLSASTVFQVTVRNPVDYDADGDGLIEISHLLQLYVVRHDLDGDGIPAPSDATEYHTAFLGSQVLGLDGRPAGMGCPIAGCSGYELVTDFNFDTNGNNRVDEDDFLGFFWNDGAGWEPIGGTYDATFAGNGYTISRLTMNRTISGSNGRAGLFASLGSNARVTNLALENVHLDIVTTTLTQGNHVSIGALAGSSDGRIDQVFSTGFVSVEGPGTRGAWAQGGLVGRIDTATGQRGIYRSYSTAEMHSEGGAYAGGLVGLIGHSTAAATYSSTRIHSTGQHFRLGGHVARSIAGSGSSTVIEDSYTLSLITADAGDDLTQVDAFMDISNRLYVSDSYWDTERTGRSGGSAGVGRSTAALQADTNSTVAASDYSGIYANWNASEWDFGTSSEYPVLKVDFDGDGVATWQEFGDQRQTRRPQVVTPIADVTLDINQYQEIDLFPPGRRAFSDWSAGRPFETDYQYSLTVDPPAPTWNTARFEERLNWIQMNGTSAGEFDVTITAENSVGLSASQTFKLTIRNQVDYDVDDDGLIELRRPSELNAIRWDLNGDGIVDNQTDAAKFSAGLPKPAPRMGCPTVGCTGYELRLNLDFDSNGDNLVDATDHDGAFWNDGAGWTPIGTYTGTFEGNRRTISNLFINQASGAGGNWGLFSVIGDTGVVRGVDLEDVGISVNRSNAKVGALAGVVHGTIQRVFSTGTITARGSSPNAGGLVGELAQMSGSSVTTTIEGSYSTAAVSSTYRAGGLTGSTQAATITRSYATGAISAANTGGTYHFGGITGLLNGSTLQSTWASGAVTLPNATAGHGGGLVGRASNSTINESLALGAVTATGTTGTSGGIGGLVGTSTTFVPTIAADTYWDTTTTGQTNSIGNPGDPNATPGGTGKTTSELQTDTEATVAASGYNGIYKDWTHTNWHYGTSSQYPALEVDFDNNGSTTSTEFGPQR